MAAKLTMSREILQFGGGVVMGRQHDVKADQVKSRPMEPAQPASA
jgi:hypothetical protein